MSSNEIKSRDRYIDELEQELKKYQEGYKGGCYACERVGELNIALEKELLKEQRSINNYAEFTGIGEAARKVIVERKIDLTNE